MLFWPYGYYSSSIRLINGAGESFAAVANEYGLAEFGCRWLSANAECPGAGDGDAYSSAYKELGDGSVPEGEAAGGVL